MDGGDEGLQRILEKMNIFTTILERIVFYLLCCETTDPSEVWYPGPPTLPR